MNGLVFTSADGAPLRSPNFRHRVWRPAVETAGLPGVRFHDLRHTHAALLIAQGEHPKIIQARLGHASIRTALDTCGHLFDGMDRGAANRLDEAIRFSGVSDLCQSADSNVVPLVAGTRENPA